MEIGFALGLVTPCRNTAGTCRPCFVLSVREQDTAIAAVPEVGLFPSSHLKERKKETHVPC